MIDLVINLSNESQNWSIPLIAAGIGAFAGAYFAELYRRRNELDQKIAYLHYTISSLLDLIPKLLKHKEQIKENLHHFVGDRTFDKADYMCNHTTFGFDVELNELSFLVSVHHLLNNELFYLKSTLDNIIYMSEQLEYVGSQHDIDEGKTRWLTCTMAKQTDSALSIAYILLTALYETIFILGKRRHLKNYPNCFYCISKKGVTINAHTTDGKSDLYDWAKKTKKKRCRKLAKKVLRKRTYSHGKLCGILKDLQLITSINFFKKLQWWR